MATTDTSTGLASRPDSRMTGRGRSTAFTPDEVNEMYLRQSAGVSIRALAREFGVSHETVRRYLALVRETTGRAVAA